MAAIAWPRTIRRAVPSLATPVSQLVRDHKISKSTGYDYLHEGIDVLAAQTPNLHGALLAAKQAGYGHVSIDGTLIETDRVSTPGPTEGVDLWWSGKHGNVSLDPWRIGAIVAAALVVLHDDHGRTT